MERFCILLIALFAASGAMPQTTQPCSSCLQEGITFTTQEQIDDFQTKYPHCTAIEGDVTISGWSNITNLHGLNVLTSVGGNLTINQTISLTNLYGLEGLTDVGGCLNIYSTGLEGLSGLNNLVSIGGYLNVYNNNSLRDLDGLENIISIGGDLIIQENDRLNSLIGLRNLSTIGADLNIGGNNNLPNLNGLTGLTKIDSNVFICNNSAMLNFYGLDSLTSIEGAYVVVNNQSLTDFSGLENLVDIGGSFHIGDYYGDYGAYNESLTSLSGLEGLTTIGGEFWIMWNVALNNLSGLSGLNSVGENLIIYGNSSLIDLKGLEGLMFVNGNLEIKYNNALLSLEGLENIDLNSINSISIYNNPSLSFCEIPNLCGYLDTLNTTITIYGNKSGCNNPSEIAESCGIEFSCLPFGDYYFVSQADIDSFPSDYPDCTQLEGSTFIRGSDITNLNGLSTVTQIGDGGLYIQNNEVLSTLMGLDNLDTIAGNLSIGGEYPLNYNNSLVTLNGINLLKSIGGDLYIGYNLNLVSLKGLEGLNSIGRSLIFTRNVQLNDMSTLSDLKHVGGDMVIGGVAPYQGNFSLQSLTGLENIKANSIENLLIGNNTVLSECEVKSICDYLAAPTGDVYIYSNATGCNTPQEVLAACEAVSVEDIKPESSFSIYSNPATLQITIETSAIPQRNTYLTLYDLNGRQLFKKQIMRERTVVVASTLPRGIYILKVTDDRTVQVTKFIKQ